MTSSPDLFSVLAFFIVVLGILYDLYLWNTANGIIQQCLKQNGMLNIKIARNWFALGGTLKFDVTYTMPNGIRYENSCKLYIRWLSLDNEIVWRDPL